MAYDREIINRRNVVFEVKKKVNACKQFFNITMDARIIAATLTLMGMKDINDIPAGFPDISKLTKEGRVAYIHKVYKYLGQLFLMYTETSLRLVLNDTDFFYSYYFHY